MLVTSKREGRSLNINNFLSNTTTADQLPWRHFLVENEHSDLYRAVITLEATLCNIRNLFCAKENYSSTGGEKRDIEKEEVVEI